MSDYSLHVNGDRVKVSRIINGELELIRFGGEVSLPIDGFWSRFKAKIEYEVDEYLAFIVVTDDDSFKIESSINIADQFNTCHEELAWILGELSELGNNIYISPEVNLTVAKASKTTNKVEQQPKVTDQTEANEIGSLQSFFRKKTREYERGK